MNIFYRSLLLTIVCISASFRTYAQFKNGVYYIYNVQADLYLGYSGANTYDASLVQHGHPFIFTVYSDSLYTLDSQVFSDEDNHYFGANNKINSEPALWQFVKTSDGCYAITNDNKRYLACEKGSTSITTNTNINNIKAQWKIINEEDRANELKSGSDATFLIRNAEFIKNFAPDYQESFWTINSASDENSINLSGGTSTNTCAIANHATFDISQDVEGIPCGTYSLQAQGFYRLDGTRSSYIPEIYLDDESQTFFIGTQSESSDNDASASFSMNLYNIKGLETTTYNGKIVVGACLERGTKLRSYFDNFTLTYVKDLDLEGYKKALEESVKDAEATLEKKMNNGVRDSILSILSMKDSVDNTIESIKPYVYALNKARKKGNESANCYEKLIDVYEKCTGLDEFGQKMFNELTSGIIASYEDGLITDGKTERKQIDSLYLVALKSQITVGTDMTRAIVNPNINGSTGWTCEKPNGGNGPLLNNVSFEYWASNSISVENRSFDYYQTITGLQNGKYTVSCYAYNSRSANDTIFYPSCGLYAYNGTDSVRVYVDTEGTEYKEYTTPEIEAIDHTLTIGVTNFTTMPARWFSADTFRLTLVSPDPALAIEEAIDDTNISIEGIYSINGIKRKELEDGINIIKYSNGKITKKYK